MIAALGRDLAGLGSFLARNARLVVIAAATAAVLLRAPSTAFGERYLGALVYFGVVPLVIGLCLGRDPRKLGLTIGSPRAWLPLTLLYMVVACAVLLATRASLGLEDYRPSVSAGPLCALVELSIFMIGWEFLFRGFLLFGLREQMGEAAVLLQMVPFVLVHASARTPETAAGIVSGIYFGYVCHKGGSFLPAVLMHTAASYLNVALSRGYL